MGRGRQRPRGTNFNLALPANIFPARHCLAEGFTSWECVERRKGKCKAKVKLTDVYDFVAEINEHTHAPSPTNCELTKIRANIKRKAETTQDTTQQRLPS